MAQHDTPNTDRPTFPTPESVFGHPMGADRQLVRWPALVEYFRSLADASDRVRFEELGKDSGEQPMVLLTISSPDNLARLEEIRAGQQRLADQRGLGDDERAALIAAGKAIVLVTCSVHGNEVGGTQMTPELVHDFVTRDDDDIRQILDHVVLLLVPSLNPAGLEFVADWYERTLDTPSEGTQPPGLYHRYAGHDNNRDWFMQVLPETRLAIGKVQNRWRPHIVFDLHQMQNTGPRYVLPPFIDPYDENVDPILTASINELGNSMASALIGAGRTGIATGIIFDAFSPSRAYQHYHGGIRILSEAASVRIATPIELTPEQLTTAGGLDPTTRRQNQPAPWTGGAWTLRDIVDNNLISVHAVLQHAARFRDRWVRNFATVQRRSLERTKPYAFLIPEDQPDPSTRDELIAVLRGGDVEVERASEPFDAGQVTYPVGTAIVRMAQPFGGFAKTLLERQEYPDLRQYPGGPLRPPYDNTAHSLPLQMGVRVVAVEQPFEANAKPESPSDSKPMRRPKPSQQLVISPRTNDGVRLVNRALDMGAIVGRATGTEPETKLGSFIVTGLSNGQLADLAAQAHPSSLGRLSEGEQPALAPIRLPRVGLYRSWRPQAIDGGWSELILGDYGFRPEVLRNQDFRQGGLSERFDAIVLPQESPRAIADGNSAEQYPNEFAGGLGDLGAYHLRRFVAEGGTLVALDSAAAYAITALYLPVRNVLEPLKQADFFSPGSIIRLLVDPAHPLAWGYDREIAAMFVSSPAFASTVDDGSVSEVARYPNADMLLSGWMQGAEHLADRAALVDVRYGKGRVVLFGFRPQYRAQARGTYRLLFNALYRSVMDR